MSRPRKREASSRRSASIFWRCPWVWESFGRSGREINSTNWRDAPAFHALEYQRRPPTRTRERVARTPAHSRNMRGHPSGRLLKKPIPFFGPGISLWWKRTAEAVLLLAHSTPGQMRSQPKALRVASHSNLFAFPPKLSESRAKPYRYRGAPRLVVNLLRRLSRASARKRQPVTESVSHLYHRKRMC